MKSKGNRHVFGKPFRLFEALESNIDAYRDTNIRNCIKCGWKIHLDLEEYYWKKETNANCHPAFHRHKHCFGRQKQ